MTLCGGREREREERGRESTGEGGQGQRGDGGREGGGINNTNIIKLIFSIHRVGSL